MKKTKSILYVRYTVSGRSSANAERSLMDDWVIMCDNKWMFKRIIKKVLCILKKLNLEIAYDKAKVSPSLKLCRIGGWTSTKCFDFLGFSISKDGLKVAKKSVQKLAERIIMKLDSARKAEKGRVYDSGCLGVNSVKGDLSISEDISRYVKRWLIWIKSMYEKENQGVCPPLVIADV